MELVEVVEHDDGLVEVVNGDSIACVLSSLGLSRRGGVWSARVLCEPSFLECLLEVLERAGYAGDVRIPRISPPGGYSRSSRSS
ncbi:MAG: hypothetical protein JZD41_00890 [Thermoproteus sp.]|nr:hypothetical protein [Thermoproteus sp.]